MRLFVLFFTPFLFLACGEPKDTLQGPSTPIADTGVVDADQDGIPEG